MGLRQRTLRRKGQRELNLLAADRPDLVQRSLELRKLVLLTLAETADVFIRLKPEGRELTEKQLVASGQRLEEGARCLRTLDSERELIEVLATQGQRMDLRAPISVLRRFHRSLILASSDDPIRRRRAGSRSDHAVLLSTVLEQLGLYPLAPEQ